MTKQTAKKKRTVPNGKCWRQQTSSNNVYIYITLHNNKKVNDIKPRQNHSMGLVLGAERERHKMISVFSKLCCPFVEYAKLNSNWRYWLSYFFAIQLCFSAALSFFYPYGVSNGDTALPTGDDSSSGSISISVPFPFFNSNYNSLYVSKYALIQ